MKKNKNLFIGIAIGIFVISSITWAATEAPRFYLELLKSRSDDSLAERMQVERDAVAKRDEAQRYLDTVVTQRVNEELFNKNITCALCSMKKESGEKCSDASEQMCNGFSPNLQSFL